MDNAGWIEVDGESYRLRTEDRPEDRVDVFGPNGYRILLLADLPKHIADQLNPEHEDTNS